MGIVSIRRAFSFCAFFVCVLVICLFPGVVQSQKIIESTSADVRLDWYQKHLELKENSPFKELKWQFIGPTNISGRVTDVAVATPKGESYTVFAATASGGVWRTKNEGTSWEPVFEHGPSTSIGDVTIAPSDPNVVWIGTGEANIFRSSMAGAGVYKSTDGGDTWKSMGLEATHTVPRIIIHPTNPDIVYVAATGHEWTKNKERGLYKTTDGGKTWKNIMVIDDLTGVNDIVMDPGDSETLYISTWQRIRKKWRDPRVEKGYDKSRVYVSNNGGNDWDEITNGLPKAEHCGRIGIDIARSNTNVLYAFIDNYETSRQPEAGELDSYGRPREAVIKGAEVYRTDDKGKNWRKVSKSDEYMEGLASTYGWVFGQIRVDPNNEDRIYVMGLALNVSDDAGKSFRRLRGMHGDHHALWIDPDNSDYLVNGNDGGIYFSYDRGKNWRSFTDRLPVVQFFNLAYDMAEPFRVYGSIQDHGSRRGYVDLSRGRDNIPAVDFEYAPGGEGSTHAIDPHNPDRVYSAGFYGRIDRTDFSKKDNRGRPLTKRILPKMPEGSPALRGQWVAPFIISSHNPNVVYHGMQFVFKTGDRGETWKKISGDLTYNDPAELGDIAYQTLFSLSESPVKYGLLYAGTDDGRVHVTRNDGGLWKEIVKGLPYKKFISRIVASKYKENVVYLAQNGKREDDFAAYLWVSDDYGDNWKSIAKNLPGGPVNVVREDPFYSNILYVGTDLGVYVSADTGRTWSVLATGLPTTFVHDIVIHPRDKIMVIATHGRGMYALDIESIHKYGK